MRERITLAGAEAHVGIVVLSLFLLLGILAAVGVGALLVTGEVTTDATGIATYIAGVVVVLLWARLVTRDLRAVRVVDIADDGSWHLRGPLGIPRGTIDAGVARTVTPQTRDTWIFGVARRYTQAWATIEAGGRTWQTARGPLSSISKSLDRLLDAR